MYWERFAARRISRRRALQAGGVAGLTAGAWALAGCSNSSPSTPAGATPAGTVVAGNVEILNASSPARPGGTLVIAHAANFGTFDPHLGVAVASSYMPRIYNALLNQSVSNPEFMAFDLAESYEVPDDNTVIFKIRRGVRVAPNDLGVPERDLDGEDVRVTIERIKSDGLTSNHSFPRDHIESVRVDGDHVVMTMPKPYAWFLYRIGHSWNTIPPRELLAGDLDRLTNKTAGGGPYRLTSVTEGEVARIERNPNYYGVDAEGGGAQLPYIDTQEVRVIFDRSTHRTAFQDGQVHQYLTGTREEASSLDNAVIGRDANYTFVAITMNGHKKPFDDPRVRRAIARAINRQEYVDLVYEGDAQANGLVHWPLGPYALPPEELEQLQPFDLEEARRLVAEVGGIRMKMMYPANVPILEHDQHLPIFLAQMEEAGIEVDQDPQDFGTWVTNIKDINYDCTLNLNQIYETPEVPLAIHTPSGPFGDGTYLRGLSDPDIEAAVRKASALLDTDARIEAVREAQRVIYSKDPVSLPLVSAYNYAAWRKEIHNVPTGIGTSFYFINTMWMDS